MHAYSNTGSWDPNPRFTNLFQQLQIHSSNVSLNRIKIHTINSTDRNRLLPQVIHFRNAFEAVALQSSQRLPELLFYTKKSYRILQLQLQLQSYKSIHIQPTRAHYTPENSPSRIQFYMQKTKSSSSTTTTFQRAKRPSFQKRNSTHRRQGDLLEMHPCVLQDLPMTFQAFQPQDLPKALQLLQLLQRHSGHSSHSWPSSLSRQFYKFYVVPVSPGNPPHSSILRSEWTFYIFYSSIGFQKTPPSTSWAITYISTDITFFKEREMLWYRSNVHR